MTGDKRKFIYLKEFDGGVVRFGNNSPCMVKGKGSISLNGKINIDDVYWVEDLKHYLLSVGQLNDKDYHLEFKNGVCRILGCKRELNSTSKQTKGNSFHLKASVNSCLVAKVEDSGLWHRRFFHVNFDNVVKVSKPNLVRGMPQLVKPDNVMCKECQLDKMTTSSFKSKSFSSEHILDLVHTDLCGPMRTRIFYGDKYFMLFTDDFSRMMWVTFMKEKSKAFSKFKAFKALVEKETGKNLKCLRSYRGGEFTSDEIVRCCDENGIKRQLSTPRKPQQNGIAERRNKTIVEAARTMLIQGYVPKIFWREAVNIAVYTLNRVLVKKGNDRTPYELWFGKNPNVSYFKVFGSGYFIKKR